MKGEGETHRYIFWESTIKSYDRANSKKVKKGSVLKQRKTHDNLLPNLPTRIPMKLSSKFTNLLQIVSWLIPRQVMPDLLKCCRFFCLPSVNAFITFKSSSSSPTPFYFPSSISSLMKWQHLDIGVESDQYHCLAFSMGQSRTHWRFDWCDSGRWIYAYSIVVETYEYCPQYSCVPLLITLSFFVAQVEISIEHLIDFSLL